MTKFLSLLSILTAAWFALGFSSCIEDGVSGSSAHQPTFSTDTLAMGEIFTEQVSTTARLTVYNRADKGISISRIALTSDNADCFRLNVDGFSGREFSDVEIRANDSIFVLVSVTLPPNELDIQHRVEAQLHFLTNGVDRSVAITADGRDVTRLRGVTITEDTSLPAGKPYVIFDSLAVAPGATLTLEAGAELLFHQGAYMRVDGTLLSLGTVGSEVTLKGDRTGNVAGDVSFDIMSRQWEGLFFGPESVGNRLEYTLVANTTYGVQIDGSMAPEGTVPSLTLINSRLRNSAGNGLAVCHARLEAYGTEIAEAGGATLLLWGGEHVINHCTLSNYYLFAAPANPVLTLVHTSESDPGPMDEDAGKPYTAANISNTIIYGMNTDLSHTDLAGTAVTLRHCLLKSTGENNENFIDCLWDTDPMFHTVRSDYFFDYSLQTGSPAIGAADPSLTAPQAAMDRYGNMRGDVPDLGAYVFTTDEAAGQ